MPKPVVAYYRAGDAGAIHRPRQFEFTYSD